MENEYNDLENENEVNEPAPKYEYISLDEYLKLDLDLNPKLEYYDGHIIELDAVSLQHDRIEQNLSGTIGNFLDEKGCEMMGPNMRVGVTSENVYMYSDRVICCGEMNFKLRPHCLLNPAVIIEVLSPSTKGIDKKRKLEFYKKIPSLQEYIMIDSQKREVIVVRKQADNSWKHEEILTRHEILFIQTIGYHLPLAEIYKGTGH